MSLTRGFIRCRIERYCEIALLHRQRVTRCWTFPFHFARLTLKIVLKEAENHVMNGTRGTVGRQRGGSHGQQRRTRSRETKTKEKGNQTDEQAGETSRSIQTGDSGTARATEYAPREDALARSRSGGRHRRMGGMQAGEIDYGWHSCRFLGRLPRAHKFAIEIRNNRLSGVRLSQAHQSYLFGFIKLTRRHRNHRLP